MARNWKVNGADAASAIVNLHRRAGCAAKSPDGMLVARAICIDVPAETRGWVVPPLQARIAVLVADDYTFKLRRGPRPRVGGMREYR
jgi:hypothetical protein